MKNWSQVVYEPIAQLGSRFHLHDLRQYHDLKRYRNRSPLQLLLLFADSIYSIVLTQLVIFVALDLLLFYLMQWEVVATNTYVVACLTFAKEQLDVFPAGLLAFVLGFFQAQILGEWRSSFGFIEWGDNIAMAALDIPDHGLRQQVIKRMHQVTAITFSYLSDTFTKELQAGSLGNDLFTQEELDFVIRENESSPPYWLPAKSLKVELAAAKSNGAYDSAAGLEAAIEAHRERCRSLLKYKWVRLPLAYVQVVTLMVYLYMALALLARHAPVEGAEPVTDATKYASLCGLVVLVIKFFVFVGWLNVAVQMSYPFGEGQDQFDLTGIFSRMRSVHHHIIEPMPGDNQRSNVNGCNNGNCTCGTNCDGAKCCAQPVPNIYSNSFVVLSSTGAAPFAE